MLDLSHNAGPRIYELYPTIHRTEIVRQLSPNEDPNLALQLGIFRNGTQLIGTTSANQNILIVDGVIFGYDINKSEHSNLKSAVTSNQISAAEQLDEIKNSLGLSVTQMAELFGVTRKTIYDWFEGVEPRANAMNRIDVMLDVLHETSQDVDIRKLRTVWSFIVSERSFLATFNDYNIDATTLRVALAEKLHELYPRLVKSSAAPSLSTTKIGNAHLAEFERST